jgi:CRISPR-associated protein Csa5
MSKLVEILALLGAMRDYSYIDRLSTALNETSVYEALKDAVRAYLSLCPPDGSGWAEYKDKRYECPKVAGDELEREVEEVLKAVKGRSGADIVRYSRELAMRAYAAIPKVRVEAKQAESKAG